MTPIPPAGVLRSEVTIARVPFGFDVVISVRTLKRAEELTEHENVPLYILACGILAHAIESSGVTHRQLLRYLRTLPPGAEEK